MMRCWQYMGTGPSVWRLYDVATPLISPVKQHVFLWQQMPVNSYEIHTQRLISCPCYTEQQHITHSHWKRAKPAFLFPNALAIFPFLKGLCHAYASIGESTLHKNQVIFSCDLNSAMPTCIWCHEVRVRYIENFLCNRRLRVRLGEALSDIFTQENWILQTSVLSATVPVLKTSVVVSAVPPGV